MDFYHLEKPLLKLDPTLNKFAKEHGLFVTKNKKDWPERSIAWGTNVRCLIQIYLASENSGTFNLWLCASEDKNNARFWKHETPIKSLPIEAFENELYELLKSSFVKLKNWANDCSSLEFSTKLRSV